MASSPLQPLVVRHLQIKKTQQGQSILSFFLVFQICFFCSFFSDLQFITSPSSDLLLFYFPAVVLPSSSVADLLWSEEWLKAGGRSCGCSRAWWRSCCWVVFAAGGRRRADLWCPPGEGDPRVWRSWVCSGRSGGREGKRGEQRWPGKEEDCRGGCYGLRSVRPLLLQLREKAPG